MNELNGQKIRNNNFERNNDVKLSSYLNNHPNQYMLANNQKYGENMACANTYPSLANPEYIKHQQNILSGLKDLPNVNKYENNDREKLLKEQNSKKENFIEFIPSNDPTNDLLVDFKKKPMTDFFHANMVPYFGSETKQNMAGTGVPQGNYVDGIGFGEINSGFDRTTPNQTTLATFTGIDDTYMHKRETGPMFSPAETATGWVYGAPNFRPDMSRYEESLDKNRSDLTPVEPQLVGPGLNLDSEIPASGGFHDFTRILPNNVNDYKSTQLPGRVNAGKHHSSNLPTSYPGIGVSKEMDPTQSGPPGITKNKPETFWDQVRYPTMTSKVGFQHNFDYNRADYQSDFKPNNGLRDSTSYGLGNITYKETANKFTNNITPCVDQNINIGQGPLGSIIPQTSTRNPTFMSLDNNIRSTNDCNSFPIFNTGRPEMGQGNIVANYYVNETDRGTIFPSNLLPIQNSTSQGNTFYMASDVPNTTRKETTQTPYIGAAEKETQGYTFYTYDDTLKTTMKETTQVPYNGNAAKGNQGSTFYTYSDDQRTTRKQTISEASPYIGNPSSGGIADMNRNQFLGTEIYIDE